MGYGKKGTFPKPRKLSPKVTVWVDAEMDEYIANIVNTREK